MANRINVAAQPSQILQHKLLFGNGPNTVLENTVLTAELSNFSGPLRVLVICVPK